MESYLLKRAEGVLIRGAGEAVIHGEGKPIELPPEVPVRRLSERGLFAGLSLPLLPLPLHMCNQAPEIPRLKRIGQFCGGGALGHERHLAFECPELLCFMP